MDISPKNPVPNILINFWKRFKNNHSIFTVEKSEEMAIIIDTTEPAPTTGPTQCNDEEDWCRYLSPWECDHNNIGTSCLQSCEKCGNVTRGNSMPIGNVSIDSGIKCQLFTTLQCF